MQSRLLPLIHAARPRGKPRDRKLYALLLAPAGLMALLTLLALLSLSLFASPAAHAAGSGPIIHWDSSMIYAGQNNGFPWGPVGQDTIVHGEKFAANQTLQLVLAPGDSNNDATVCQQPVVTVPVTQVTTDGAGKFGQNFPWPASAGHVNQGYSICALLASNNSIASGQDDGPFTVLSASPPAITLSTASGAAGSVVTVSGQNWVPPQPVSINIASCGACGLGNTEVATATANSQGLNNGTFSTTITIPTNAKAGNYVVNAQTPTGLDVFYTTGVKHLTITATAVTPSPTPSVGASPTLTAGASTSPTVAPSAIGTITTTQNSPGTGNGSSSTGTGDTGHSTLVIILIAMTLIFFIGAGLVIFTMMHSSKKRAGAMPVLHQLYQNGPTGQHMPPGQSGQFGQFNQVGGSAPNYSQPQHQQFGQPVQQWGNAPQQNGSGFVPPYAQPTEVRTSVNNVAQGPVTYAPVCPNCGRPLTSNATNCNVCGMPVQLMRS